jgi:hypothetical protein
MNSRHTGFFWRRTPRLPNGLYLGYLFNSKDSGLALHKDYMAI